MEPNPIAAMPSIHFASTALAALSVLGTSTKRFCVALLYTVLMGVALVYLGEHYVLDLIVGGLFAVGGWMAAGWYVCIDHASDS